MKIQERIIVLTFNPIQKRRSDSFRKVKNDKQANAKRNIIKKRHRLVTMSDLQSNNLKAHSRYMLPSSEALEVERIISRPECDMKERIY
jgi:hypothetical protein